MNLAVDDFYLGEKHLGQLDLKARNEKGAWQLDVLNLKNPDGSLAQPRCLAQYGAPADAPGFRPELPRMSANSSSGLAMAMACGAALAD
jgi:hypothetical protein